jgi:hypothetical protein
MNPYPYRESKWMKDYMDFDKSMSLENIMEHLKDPKYLNQVIAEQDLKINELEDTIYKLKAPIMLKIKWKLASLMNKLPKIRIEW